MTIQEINAQIETLTERRRVLLEEEERTKRGQVIARLVAVAMRHKTDEEVEMILGFVLEEANRRRDKIHAKTYSSAEPA